MYCLVSRLVVIESLTFIFITANFLGNTAILKHFNYSIGYEINVGNPQLVIEKSESLNYSSLLTFFDVYGVPHNPTSRYFDGHLIISYINREYLEYLKREISSDSMRFHRWFGYRHSFTYQFTADFVSKINITYKNDPLIKAQYENQEEIFDVDQTYYSFMDLTSYWYINFSLIPFSVNETSILLNNSILIKMVLNYDHLYGSLAGLWYQVNQYLVLNRDLQVICIYVPTFPLTVA